MNEEELNMAVERACGSIDRSFRLMRIWEETSNPVGGTFPMTPKEKAAKRLAKFKNKAKNNGYSETAIQAYLRLQGM